MRLVNESNFLLSSEWAFSFHETSSIQMSQIQTPSIQMSPIQVSSIHHPSLSFSSDERLATQLIFLLEHPSHYRTRLILYVHHNFQLFSSCTIQFFFSPCTSGFFIRFLINDSAAFFTVLIEWFILGGIEREKKRRGSE